MTKKNFKNFGESLLNPAMQFITPQEETEEAKPVAKKKQPTKKATSKETKTKNLHLLLKPSLVEDFNKIAVMQRTSVNSLVSGLMEDYIEEHAEDIETYNKVFKK